MSKIQRLRSSCPNKNLFLKTPPTILYKWHGQAFRNTKLSIDAQEKHQHQPWTRNASKSRNTMQKRFGYKNAYMPEDIFFHCLSFLPAYPHFFKMLRVSKVWKAFLEKAYDLVKHLHLIHLQVNWEANMRFFSKVFPNVTELFLPDLLQRMDYKVQSIWKNWTQLKVIHIFQHERSKSICDVRELPRQLPQVIFYGYSYFMNIANCSPNTKYTLMYPYKCGIGNCDPRLQIVHAKQFYKKEDTIEYVKYFFGTMVIFIHVVQASGNWVKSFAIYE